MTRASEEAARLARLTDQLLFLARSDEDKFPLRLASTNIRALLARSAEQAAARASAAGIDGRAAREGPAWGWRSPARTAAGNWPGGGAVVSLELPGIASRA